MVRGRASSSARLPAAMITRCLSLYRFCFSPGLSRFSPSALSTVQARLVQLRSGFAQHGATAELPLAYLEQLSATMRKLEEICVRLAKKANGESYRYSDYYADVDAYDALVKIYTASGKRLNTWMTSLSTRPPSSR